MMTEQQIIVDLLNAMGANAKEVAELLISVGIKGRPGSADSCPVNRYIISKGGDPGGAIFTRYYAAQGFYFPTPQPVYDFIRAFDAGEYPELVEVKQ